MKLLILLAMIFSLPCHAKIDLWEDFTAPVKMKTARTVLISGAALTLTLTLLKDSIDQPFQKSTSETKPLGNYSKYGDYFGRVIPNAMYGAGMLIAGAFGNSEGYDRAEIMLMATAYSAAWTTGLKYTVGEPRPGDQSNHQSFPSGHATTAFAFASVVGVEHGWAYCIPAYAMAAFTGLSRINDNKHFLRDVIGGATIGTAYGIGISQVHQKNRTVAFAPIIGEGAYGAMAAFRF